MKKYIDEQELLQRIQLNFNRLSTDYYYSIDDVFSPSDYSWYGDKEGRALLAFVSHYKISGKIIPCMTKMIRLLPERLNSNGYLGSVFDDSIHEQQLSGHSWLLRGLCEYYNQFSDETVLDIINKTVENLYLPLSGKISTYPVSRDDNSKGDVSGEVDCTINNWILSSDIGCAFMSIDGLSQAYEVTHNERIRLLTDEMISVFSGIDRTKLKCQTHCTLTAARGMMRMYNCVGDNKYLLYAMDIYDDYVLNGGMTYTYHNLNWWGRPDTWSEPCAIVDSLMLAVLLHKASGEEKYRKFAAQVYHNAFSTLQRANGGAGTDTLVCEASPWDYLQIQMYEARFCCTMRLAEGLWFINENKKLLYSDVSGVLVKDENGIYRDGDIIYCEVNEKYASFREDTVNADGRILCPLLKMWKIPDELAAEIQMFVRFV